jgi:cell wall-associated NlpC family hydrolase
MATNGQHRRATAPAAHPWWRPLAMSAVTATIAALFAPVPALAAPNVPASPNAPLIPAAAAVPDAGARPVPLGTLVMPGQAATTPTATTSPTGLATNPIAVKRDQMQAEIAAKGDDLIKIGQDRDLATQQAGTAATKISQAQIALAQAQQEAQLAAAASVRDAAALPPGTLGSGLQDLDALARMQRGDTSTEDAAARQLAIAQTTMANALTEHDTATSQAGLYTRQISSLTAEIAKKQAALQKYETDHAAQLTAADAAETAQDQALGAQYLAGPNAGRGADARAIGALKVALTKIGDPYEWSEEGQHNTFDCSGLMYYAYHSIQGGGFPLARVAIDQYSQTRLKVVDRYSLLQGDLLFFSSDNSWTGIHHVAMYAGNGMMVEAPRTGLNVRLTPVRWTRLFQATRVYGSVDGPVQGPDLSNIKPSDDNTPPSPTPTATKTTKPAPGGTTTPTTGPTGGTPTGGTPTGGTPTGGTPTGGTPSGGTPTGGTPTGGTPTGAAPTGDTTTTPVTGNPSGGEHPNTGGASPTGDGASPNTAATSGSSAGTAKTVSASSSATGAPK